MTPWVDRALDSRVVRPIRHVQLVVTLALYAYAYLSPDPVGRAAIGWDDSALHGVGSGLLFVSVFVAARARRHLWQILGFALLVSFALEYAQSFAPLRHFDWADLLVNALGVGVAAILLIGFHRVGWIERM